MKTIPYSPFRPRSLSSVKVQRNEWVSAPRHGRYLFHLRNVDSYRDDEEGLLALRLNYAMEGIWGVGQGTDGVWANNGMGNIHTLWPVWMDSWGLSDSQGYLDLFMQYDIWRIDTSLIDNPWYVDPNMADQFEGWDRRMEYLYTDKGVHPRALTLFGFYIDEEKYLCGDSRRAPFCLVKQNRINDFIRYKWRRPIKGPIRKRRI